MQLHRSAVEVSFKLLCHHNKQLFHARCPALLKVHLHRISSSSESERKESKAYQALHLVVRFQSGNMPGLGVFCSEQDVCPLNDLLSEAGHGCETMAALQIHLTTSEAVLLMSMLAISTVSVIEVLSQSVTRHEWITGLPDVTMHCRVELQPSEWTRLKFHEKASQPLTCLPPSLQ